MSLSSVLSRAGLVGLQIAWFGLLGLFFISPLRAQQEVSPVEIDGDQVEFSLKNDLVVASGNVSVVNDQVTLLCDQLEYSRSANIAVARGNVVLIRDGQRVTGEQLIFDFNTMTGEFEPTVIAAKPFYGGAERIEKVGENHLVLHRGFLTTSDFDNPEFRFVARKIDIYPNDKAVARHVRLLVGKVPIAYLPRFTQDLRDNEPVFTYTPGYQSEWGGFLLTQYRQRFNDYVKATVHADYRERLDFGSGVDVEYLTRGFGEGVLRTYYTYERNLGRDQHIWEERVRPTPERERYKAEWRHQWEISNNTNYIGQYYLLSDGDFLQDYYEREFDQEQNPETFFLLTHNLPEGILSLRSDLRVNRFTGKVERLPQLKYTLSSLEVGDSGLYWNNEISYDNLVSKTPAPSAIRQKTQRVDTNNEISYPFKVSFIELNPFVGGRHTYYSRAKDQADYNSLRGVFRTGASLSTKFYRIFETETNALNLNINKLRHIITPSVDYLYQHDPTIDSGRLDQYDAIDSQQRAHSLNFSLENKLQTKRNEQSVDLVRFIMGSTFLLKEDPGKGGFNNVSFDLEVKPYSWLGLYFDANYDTIAENLTSANVDLFLSDINGQWYTKVSRRFTRKVDNQITTEFGWTINPKWSFRTLQRVDIDDRQYREYEYTLRRDLHAWTMDINYNHTRNEGNEVWLVFTLKAFPELGFDFGTSIGSREPGAQN